MLPPFLVVLNMAYMVVIVKVALYELHHGIPNSHSGLMGSNWTSSILLGSRPLKSNVVFIITLYII